MLQRIESDYESYTDSETSDDGQGVHTAISDSSSEECYHLSPTTVAIVHTCTNN